MIRRQSGELVYYTFESLDRFGAIVHGVTARQGGVSVGPWASLNLTKGNGDDPEAVEQNLRRVAEAFGTRREHLVSPNQRHTTRTARVTAADRGRVIPETDTLLTGDVETPILLRYADCTPVLLYDQRHLAIAVIHTGWRGTVAGAARAAVEAMTAAFETRPEDIIAGVGPSIGPCCYEVGDEVTAAARDAFVDAEALLPANGTSRRHFDLWAANRRWLIEAGVRQIEAAEICTACHQDDFFSYRGGKGRTGHFGALMMLRGKNGAASAKQQA